MAEPKFSPAALKRARKRWGQTQQEAAAEMGISISSVADWEAARKTPSKVFMRIVLHYIVGPDRRKSSE